jgi:hypothetical protein
MKTKFPTIKPILNLSSMQSLYVGNEVGEGVVLPSGKEKQSILERTCNIFCVNSNKRQPICYDSNGRMHKHAIVFETPVNLIKYAFSNLCSFGQKRKQKLNLSVKFMIAI